MVPDLAREALRLGAGCGREIRAARRIDDGARGVDHHAAPPGVEAPKTEFTDIVEPIALALAQEERVAEQIAALTKVARENNDFISEEFTQWFLKEQVEEISKMNDLLKVVRRAKDNPLLAEEFIARESFGKAGDGTEADAPPAAGAAL